MRSVYPMNITQWLIVALRVSSFCRGNTTMHLELTPLAKGQFVRLGYTIPDYARHVLTGNHSDVTFTIVLNVNAGTTGWLVDDLVLGQ